MAHKKKDEEYKKILSNKFYILSASIIIVTLMLTTWIFFEKLSEFIVSSRSEFVIDAADRQSIQHLPIGIFANENQQNINQAFDLFFNEIKLQDIIRVKIYNLNGVIIYSDEKKLVGQYFDTNEKLKKALNGETVIEVEDTKGEENKFEEEYSSLLEVYMPHYENGVQVGVIEFYYNISKLISGVELMKKTIYSIVISVSLFLIIILRVIFKSTTNRIKDAQLKESNSIKEAARLKDEFVFLAAHELRTPATLIKGYIDMAESYNEYPKYMQKISITNEELLLLVEDLLKVAKSDSGKTTVDLEPLNIEEAINNSIHKFIDFSKENGIEISYIKKKGLPNIIANKKKLEEVLNNLISNALKYNKPNGKIRISHEVTLNKVITHISDTGLGIKKEDMEKLFGRFFRGHTEERDVSGTGLGLFIVKELVNRMGGEIRVESEYGRGSTFSIEFPINL